MLSYDVAAVMVLMALGLRSAAKTTALYEQRQSSSKPLLNLIVIGHVDAGKSTLIGHLLFLLGKVDAKQMQKFEHEAKKMGKSSFMYAWVLDETGEERYESVNTTENPVALDYSTFFLRWDLREQSREARFFPTGALFLC